MNAVAQTNVVEVKKPDFYATEQVGGEIAFPEVFAQGEVGKVTRRVNRHPDCIASNPDYVPDEKRCVALWLGGTRQCEWLLAFMGKPVPAKQSYFCTLLTG